MEMNKKLIKKISEATEKQMEKILKQVCKKAGVDERILICITTGGLHYTVEHIASEIFLRAGKIDAEAREMLQLINIGFSIDVAICRDLYSSNRMLDGVKKDWDYTRRLEEVQKARNEFITKAQKLYN